MICSRLTVSTSALLFSSQACALPPIRSHPPNHPPNILKKKCSVLVLPAIHICDSIICFVCLLSTVSLFPRLPTSPNLFSLTASWTDLGFLYIKEKISDWRASFWAVSQSHCSASCSKINETLTIYLAGALLRPQVVNYTSDEVWSLTEYAYWQ